MERPLWLIILGFIIAGFSLALGERLLEAVWPKKQLT
jgi:hypothetical protein